MSGPGGPIRLDALTGVRGIAAWLVVFYHIRLSLAQLLPEWAIAALGKGYLAVDFFFMLSGFVLWLNHAERLAAGRPVAAVQFWWRRIARIWPLHIFVLAGFVALAVLLALTGRDTAGYPLAELPLHVVLMQNWGFTTALAWNHPAWSISAELGAYLLFPLLALSARVRLAPSVLLMVLTGLLAALWGWFAVHGERGLGGAIPTLGLMRCLLEFMAGAVAARLWLVWRARPRRGAIAGGMALLAGGVAGAGIWQGWAETTFVPASMVAGLLALALDPGPVARALGRGAILWLGEVSYSTYLAHFGLFIVFKLLFVDASLQLDWRQVAGFAALLLAVSGLLYRLVEQPAQRWLNAHPPRLPGVARVAAAG